LGIIRALTLILTLLNHTTNAIQGVAAWCLGFLCQHGAAQREAVALGGVETLVQVR